jgi:hypothetical protein
MKIRSVGSELFHVDGLPDMTKVIVTFRNFANPAKNNRTTIQQNVDIPIR